MNLKKIAKKISAVAVAAVVTASLTLTVPENEIHDTYANTLLPSGIGCTMVENAAKYLGYSYSQNYNRHGQDLTQTFDCSGLVAQTMKESGFTPGTIPDNTMEWRNGCSYMNAASNTFTYQHYIDNTNYVWRTLSYNGAAVEVVPAANVAEYNAAMQNPANAGKMVVLHTMSDYQEIMAGGNLPTGSFIVWGSGMVDGEQKYGHIAMVAADIKPSLNGYMVCGRDYSAAFGSKLSYVYNNILYQNEVYSDPYIQKLVGIAKNATGVGFQSVICSSADYAEAKAVYLSAVNTSQFPWHEPSGTETFSDSAWSYYDMYRQPYAKIANLSKATDADIKYSSKGIYGIESSVWLLEAAISNVGVCITNRAETSATARKVYVVGFPSASNTCAVKLSSDADTVYALTTNKELAGLIGSAEYNSAEEAIAQLSANGAYYARSNGTAAYFTLGGDTLLRFAGSGVHEVYVVQAYVEPEYIRDTTLHTVKLSDNGCKETDADIVSGKTTGSCDDGLICSSSPFTLTVKAAPKITYSQMGFEARNDEDESVGGAVYVLLSGDNELSGYQKKLLKKVITRCSRASDHNEAAEFFEKSLSDPELLESISGRVAGYFVSKKDKITYLRDFNAAGELKQLLALGNIESGSERYTILQIYSPGKYELDEGLYHFTLESNNNPSPELLDALKKSTISGLEGSAEMLMRVRGNTDGQNLVLVAGVTKND